MAYRRDNKGRFTKNDENKKYMHDDLVPEMVMPVGKKMFVMYKDGSYAVFENDREVLYKDLHAVVEDFMSRYQPCTTAAGTEDKKEKETESTNEEDNCIMKYMHGDLTPIMAIHKPEYNGTFVLYKNASFAIFDKDGNEIIYMTINEIESCYEINKEDMEEESEEDPEEEHPILNKETGKYINRFEQYDSELRQIFDYDDFVICVYQDCTIHIYEKIPSSKYDDGFYLKRIDGDNFTTEKNGYTYMEDFDPLESDEDEECECKCDKCENIECAYHPVSKDDDTKSEENASDDNEDDTESEDECDEFTELESCSGCEDAYSEGYANALENVISMFIDALTDRD